MRAFTFSLLFAATYAAACGPVFAQGRGTNNEIEFEGRLIDLLPAAGTTPARIIVMGASIDILPSTTITTPTGTLTLQELMDPRPLPGGASFKGNSTIVTGYSDDQGAWASDIFVDVQENVMLGVVRRPVEEAGRLFDVEGATVVLMPSSASGNSFPAYPKVEGGYRNPATDEVTPTHPLYDPRFKGQPMVNAYGFRIKPATVPPGTLVSAEGYYAPDMEWKYGRGRTAYTKKGVFLAWLVEVDAGELVENLKGRPAVSVLRAQCRERDNELDIEVRGGVLIPHGATAPPATVTNISISPVVGDEVETGTVGTPFVTNVTARLAETVPDDPATTDVNEAHSFYIYDYDDRVAGTVCPIGTRAFFRYQNTTNAQTRAAFDIRAQGLIVDLD